MRKLLPLCALLAVLLVSCIPVDDMGGYWDKGVIDKLLIGTWIPDKDFKSRHDSEPLQILDNEDAYRIESPDENMRNRDEGQPTLARTLQVGNYLFFMVGVRKGDLLRYAVRNGALEIYVLNAHAVRLMLAKDYPNVKNIQIDACVICSNRAKRDETYDNVKINLFDATVYDILAKIPNTPDYWHLERRYRKESPPPSPTQK